MQPESNVSPHPSLHKLLLREMWQAKARIYQEAKPKQPNISKVDLCLCRGWRQSVLKHTWPRKTDIPDLFQMEETRDPKGVQQKASLLPAGCCYFFKKYLFLRNCYPIWFSIVCNAYIGQWVSFLIVSCTFFSPGLYLPTWSSSTKMCFRHSWSACSLRSPAQHLHYECSHKYLLWRLWMCLVNTPSKIHNAWATICSPCSILVSTASASPPWNTHSLNMPIFHWIPGLGTHPPSSPLSRTGRSIYVWASTLVADSPLVVVGSHPGMI